MSSKNIKRLRIQEKNRINTHLIEYRSFLRNNMKTIERFKRSENVDYSAINKLNSKIKEQKEKIKELEERYETVNIGKLDEEILNSCKENSIRVSALQKTKDEKKAAVTEDKKERKKLSINYYKSNNKDRRDNRKLQRDMRYFDKQFFKILDSVPDYLLKKLEKMPENKGYIFRGMHLYGKQKIRNSKPNKRQKGRRNYDNNKNILTMFESKKKIQYIHEWDKENDTYSLYRRDNRQKSLIKRTERSLIKKKEVNLFDI